MAERLHETINAQRRTQQRHALLDADDEGRGEHEPGPAPFLDQPERQGDQRSGQRHGVKLGHRSRLERRRQQIGGGKGQAAPTDKPAQASQPQPAPRNRKIGQAPSASVVACSTSKVRTSSHSQKTRDTGTKISSTWSVSRV